jgi:hypothetical protein
MNILTTATNFAKKKKSHTLAGYKITNHPVLSSYVYGALAVVARLLYFDN